MLTLILSLLFLGSPFGGCIFEDGLYRAKVQESKKHTPQAVIVDIEGCLILRMHFPNKSIISVKSEELDDEGHGIIQLPNGQKWEVVVNIQEPVSKISD
jgi:hypothetical protein